MIAVGARRNTIKTVSAEPSINTKAEEKAAEKAVKIDTEAKAEKPKRRRKADK